MPPRAGAALGELPGMIEAFPAVSNVIEP